jgi:hypothetical protein
MDIVILVISAAAVFTVGYAVFWTVHAVRRVGLYRFIRALGAFMWAVVQALIKLLTPLPDKTLRNDGKRKQYRWIDAWDDMRIADEWQRVSDTNSKIGHEPDL